MTLIPRGPYKGWVLVWDYGPRNNGASLDVTVWTLFDPATKTFKPKYTLQHGPGEGDLGCSGHAWTEDGRLFVAGGFKKIVRGAITGSRLAFVFDPMKPLGNAMWTQQPNLERDRWYPTVSLIADGRLLVLGGDLDATLPKARNTYEAFVPPAGAGQGTWDKVNQPGAWNHGKQVFEGPPYTGGSLDAYPRAHLVGNGRLFLSGMNRQSSWRVHSLTSQTWPIMGDSWSVRYYGASVVCPNSDPTHTNSVMKIGGSTNSSDFRLGALETVQMSKASQAGAQCWPSGYYWTDTVCDDTVASMSNKRVHHNAVLAPDAAILVFGGENATGPVLAVERYLGGGWTTLASASSVRDMHSTAVLLPDGKVLVAGGENRSWDYEIYDPPYLTCGAPRPTNVVAPGDIYYGQEFTVSYTLAAGASLAKVVLMRPGSVTHAFDSDQRYLELAIVGFSLPPSQSVLVLPPAGAPGSSADPDFSSGPPGFYMLFLVTDAGVPSVAQWVRLKR